jgi:hypothetical protein
MCTTPSYMLSHVLIPLNPLRPRLPLLVPFVTGLRLHAIAVAGAELVGTLQWVLGMIHRPYEDAKLALDYFFQVIMLRHLHSP